MKKNLILLILIIFSLSIVRAQQPRGIDLGEYAFGIPAEQLNFNNKSPFTLSFWLNIKEFAHKDQGTLLLSIRNPEDLYPLNDWGWMWTCIINDNSLESAIRAGGSFQSSKELTTAELEILEWVHLSFVFDYESYRKLTLYVNGVSVHEINLSIYSYDWKKANIIAIGGPSVFRAPLNASIDKVQFYNKTLSQAEVKVCMTSPLLNDESLLGYWDFEDDCVTDANGFMQADKGTIKATMYKILSNSSGYSTGTEIQPFVFGEGVDPESVVQGVEENNITESKTKAFVSNEILNIENAEGINSVVVYDATGKVITTVNANAATFTQIALPSTIKGVLVVKVNNDVIKVVSNN